MVLLLTLAVHAVLLWLLMHHRPDTTAPQPGQQRLLVQLIAEPRRAATGAPLSFKTVKAVKAIAPSAPPRADSKPIEQAPITVTAALPPEPAASAAAPQAAASKPWLDPEKTRLAVRRLAALPSLREQAALASEAPRQLTAGERFGQEVQQAAAGDCLKGEFLGGGMGLLSAPFWALAEARGKCRR